jgi:hypothetical protein
MTVALTCGSAQLSPRNKTRRVEELTGLLSHNDKVTILASDA